ncbi:MAG TPA: DUF3613 domain-containing protein [Solimonas sp.]
MKTRRVFASVAAALGAGLLMTSAPLSANPGEQPSFGADTRAWVELQRSGAAASPEVQPVPGEVADKVYQRYLKSFDQPIPAEFDRERFVSGSSGGP